MSRGIYDKVNKVRIPIAGAQIPDVDETIIEDSPNPVAGGAVYDALQNIHIDVDSALSGTSENPVQNKVIKSALDNKLGTNDIAAWAKESTKPTYTASEVGLGNVGNFKAVSTEASQSLTDTEKSNARNNIGAGTSSFSGSYNDLSNKPTLGTASAKDVASSGDASSSQVVMGNDSRLTDSRNAADVYAWAKASTKPTYTASEVGLGNVGNFKAVSTEASQGLTDTEKSNARANIGAGTSSFSGNYNDLSNKPTIPTKTSDLTNDSNFVQDANYTHISVDSAMSDSSTNTVQNKIIKQYVDALQTAITNGNIQISIPMDPATAPITDGAMWITTT